MWNRTTDQLPCRVIVPCEEHCYHFTFTLLDWLPFEPVWKHFLGLHFDPLSSWSINSVVRASALHPEGPLFNSWMVTDFFTHFLLFMWWLMSKTNYVYPFDALLNFEIFLEISRGYVKPFWQILGLFVPPVFLLLFFFFFKCFFFLSFFHPYNYLHGLNFRFLSDI